jgi:uncharacterized membrane protein
VTPAPLPAAEPGIARDGAPCWRIELLPNCALSPETATLFFVSVAVTPLLIGVLFVARGLWPVLPFAGLELGLLGWALRASLRRRHATQTVEISDTEVAVTTRSPAGEQRILFSRHWAKVTLRGYRGWQPSRLLIESHGRTCEVGTFLTEEERRSLAKRLRALIGPTSDSPPLGPPGAVAGN